jgi:hypothetical protein
MNERRDAHHNPQTLWESFKMDITKYAKQTIKTKIYKKNSTIQKLNKHRKEILENLNYEDDDNLKWEEALIANQIEYLENLDSRNQRQKTHTNIILQGEKLGSAWSQAGKGKKLRDLITRLEVPNLSPKRYETQSIKMAELMKEYHQNIQNNDITNFKGEEARTQAIDQILDEIPDLQKLPTIAFEANNQLILREHVSMALKSAKMDPPLGLMAAHMNSGRY